MTQTGPAEHSFRGPFLLAIAAAIVSTIDPLGIEEATADRSVETAMRLAATFYPAESELVTVVTLDEDYAKRTRGTWPLSYRQQGHILSLIAGFEPTAIFVDLIYRTPHEDPTNPSLKGDDPGNLLGALPPDTRTPIYLSGLAAPGSPGCRHSTRASSIDAVLDEHSVLPSIREDPLIKGKGRIALVEWDGCEDLYPLYLGDNPAAATPAYALYREWSCKGDANCLTRTTNESFARPMKILWGAFPPRAQSAFYAYGACQYGFGPGQQGHSIWRRIGAIATQLKIAVLGADYADLKKNDKNAMLPCPAVNVIPATVFAGVDPENQQFRDQLEPLLKNHLVLVGADLRGAGDTVLSPVHGQIPGVQLHAMALDNLVRFESDYTREAPEWVLKYVLPPIFLTLIAWLTFRFPLWKLRVPMELAGLALLAWIAYTFAQELEWIKPAYAIVGGLVLYVIAPTAAFRASFAIVLVIGVAIFAIELGYSPRNWMVLAVAAALVSEKVYEDVHGEREEHVVKGRIAWVRQRVTGIRSIFKPNKG